MRSGHKPNLREAVRDAARTACLVLKPGLYRESLVIKKDLQIRAEGEPREVTLESLAYFDRVCWTARAFSWPG